MSWDIEEDSMVKTEFDQTSFMRNYGRSSLQALIPRDWVSTENVVCIYVCGVCEFYISRYYFFFVLASRRLRAKLLNYFWQLYIIF